MYEQLALSATEPDGNENKQRETESKVQTGVKQMALIQIYDKMST